MSNDLEERLGVLATRSRVKKIEKGVPYDTIIVDIIDKQASDLEIVIEALRFYTSREILAPGGLESVEGWTAEFGEKARQAIERIENEEE